MAFGSSRKPKAQCATIAVLRRYDNEERLLRGVAQAIGYVVLEAADAEDSIAELIVLRTGISQPDLPGGEVGRHFWKPST
jgi:hypothetical protein